MKSMVMATSKGPPGATHLRPFCYTSIAATHPGRVRMLNEDACLDRADVGLWAVADGMGGHDAGDVASATVIGALARVRVFESAFAFRRAVRTALFEANADLQNKAAEQLVATIGATVVALLVHGNHYACVWAGDSRAYLWRSGALQRITRDHNLAEELGAAPISRGANIVTRAVGAHATLELDGVYGRIHPGDRFLLCSDGLEPVGEHGIAAALANPEVIVTANSLIRQTLGFGAPDNVSVVVIECRAQA